MLRDHTKDIVTRWLGRTGFAVADQALLSGTTFTLNILFARWMSAQEFGVFAVEMACILLVGSIQNALVLEPMTVFGARKYRLAVDAYVRKLGLLQLAAFAVFGGAVVASVEIGGWAASPQNALTLGLTPGFVMLAAFVRRTIYLETLPLLALADTAAYAVSSIGLALLWHRHGDLSPDDALLVVAAGSGVAAAIGWGLFRRHRRAEPRFGVPPTMRALYGDHWRYGRWALGTAIVYVGSSAAYPPIIASILSFQAAGIYRAVETLFAPIGQLVTALSTLALPAIVAQRSRNERAVTRSVVSAALLGAGAVAALYAVPMVLFGPAVARYIFAKPEYASDWWFIAFMGLAATIGAAQSAAYLFLRSLERPHGEFWSQLSVAAVTFTIGIAGGLLAGLDGLTAALVMARIAGLVVALGMLGKGIAKHQRSPAAADRVPDQA
jgi:O-antigen/teichoic acid export membrane protein